MGKLGSRLTTPVLGVLLCAPISAQVTQRVSVSSSGSQVHGGSEWFPWVSADGRYVAFSSWAYDLDPWGDGNKFTDIFVRDRQNGTTEIVSVDSNGTPTNNNSYFTSISDDGRFVVFDSDASNLVPGDTNGAIDVFVRDRQTRTTDRVSVDSGGAQGSGESDYPSISADGRCVVFTSNASNLVPGDTNGVLDILIRDLQTGTTERVSVDSSGAQGNDDSQSHAFSVSADGRLVAFTSVATNLVPGDTNGFQDVFVHDRQTGVTERVSVDSSGVEGNNDSLFASISADGGYVAFMSLASNLVPGDTNGYYDVFVRDRQSGTTERVSVDSGGAQGNNWSYWPSISAAGRYVAFTGPASNLVPGDTNGHWDVFLRDRQTGTTERVSVSSGGAQGNSDSNYPSMSSDGRYVAFWSGANNLVPGDTNGVDSFLRDRLGGPTFTSLCDPGVGGVIVCPCSNAPSGPGRGCDNSSATGGAILSASGGTYLSSDSLVFTTNGEKPTALSIVLQATTSLAAGIVYGQGVRCVGGSGSRRLFTKHAVGGSIEAPDIGAGDPTVSARSAAKGDVIQPGQSRWYFVFYRDPMVLGGCPATSTFNATQTGRVDWSF